MIQLKIYIALAICFGLVSCTSSLKTKQEKLAIENIESTLVVSNENYKKALKRFLVSEWNKEKQKDEEIGEIIFEDNILSVYSVNNFMLSSYNFDDIKIVETKNSAKKGLTILNEGGGGGGNVVVSETYYLTPIEGENFKIEKGKFILLNE